MTKVELDSIAVHKVLERFREEFSNKLAQVFFTMILPFTISYYNFQISKVSQDSQKLATIANVLKQKVSILLLCYSSISYFIPIA